MGAALDKIDSRYRLAVIVMKRAKMIRAGKPILVKSRHSKPVIIALDEFVQGKFTWSETTEEAYEELEEEVVEFREVSADIAPPSDKED
jgi:DNA-directed RNA polymerase omega subunit